MILTVLFLFVQGIRGLLTVTSSTSFTGDVLIQAIGSGLIFYVSVGWKLRRSELWSSNAFKEIHPVASLAAAVSIGTLTGLVFFGVLFLFREESESQVAGISLLRLGLIVPVAEEVYFRLVLGGSMKQNGVPNIWTVVLTALFFALTHDYSVAPFLFPVGLAAGWLFLRFGVIASISMHATYNLAILIYSM